MKLFRSFPPLFLLLFFGFARPVLAQTGDFRFKHLTTQQGLSQNSVWSICQDREGFMWFGTIDGLNRYDGYTFTVLKPDPRDPAHTLHHNIISDIHEDRQGRLWVTTFGGGLHQVNKQTNQVTRYGIKPTSTVLWNVLSYIYEDRAGMLWICGLGGIARFDPQTKQFTLFSPSAKRVLISSVAEDAAGRLWVGGGGDVYQLDRQTGKFTSVALDSSLVGQLIGAITLFIDQKGILWVGTRGEGLFRLDTRQPSSRFARYNPGGLINQSIRFNGITEDAKGHLWLATTKGLQRIDTQRGQVRNFDSNPSQPGSLSQQFVSAVYHERNGTLWLGTDTGINKAETNAKRFRAYQVIPTPSSVVLNKNHIRTLLEDHTGTVWLGSAGNDVSGGFSNGLFRQDAKSGQITPLPANPADPSSLSSDRVWSVYEDRKNQLWVGTQEALHRLDAKTGKFTRYPSEIPVQCIAEDPSGKLWIGGGWDSREGGIGSLDPVQGQFTYYKSDPTGSTGPKNKDVWDIMASRTGDIWVALSGAGIARLNQRTGKITSYESNPTAAAGHLNDKDVRTLYEDAEGTVWAGTNQGGLHRFDAQTNTFTYFSTREGLASNHVVSITGDQRGNLWLGTNKGLSRFNTKTKTFRNYDVSDGLPANEFNLGSVYRKKDKLLFGTVNGFVVFHPDSIRDNALAPPVYLTGLKVLEKSRIISADRLELSHQENFLSFEFVALNYDAPEKNQYAYQLVGVDKAWIYSGTRRFASYTNLPPGDYTLRVKASNNDGVWNEKGATFKFTIHPPWWRTWWAYGFYGLCVLAGVFALDRYQRRRLINRERERTKERELAQAREIERAYHELKQTQTQLIQKEKMASLGELTAGIAHEIQNPLNFVNNFSEVSTELVDELKEEITADRKSDALDIADALTQNLQKITQHGQRASSIVRGMLEHARTSTGEKLPTDLNALADEYLRLTYHGLRAKDKDFNATLTTDFEADLGRVNVVPQELGRVLLNLFNNAFYATQQKKLLPNDRYKPEVKVSTRKVGDQVEISVKDNGTGIPEKIKDKIFQPFFTTKPTGQGTGLGLSLSYDIITKGHQGELKLTSQKGEFTEFVIVLPTG